MPPEPRRAELELYYSWEERLVEFFQLLQTDREAGGETAVESAGGGMRSYRSRVGQDLKAFHEKLASIMESDKRG